MMAKRLFDIVCAAAALVLTAPLLLVAALGIKLTDRGGGPVFYRARRIGYLGRQFTMYKLRTMRNGHGARITAGTGHKRGLPFGRLLRPPKNDQPPHRLHRLRGGYATVGRPPRDPAAAA